MKRKSVALLIFSIINLSINIAIAQPKIETKALQNSVQTLTPYEQQTKQIEELQRSQAIETKVKEEVERTFNAVFQPTINLINWNIGIINFLLIVIPIGGAICLWLFQTSIIPKFELDTRKELQNQIDKN